MTDSLNREDLMRYIVTVYKECNISSYPIDCFSVLRHYGFRIYTYSYLKKQNLQLYRLAKSFTNDSFIIGDIVAYNEQKNKNRISFSLMHEFGHYILGHEEETPENEEEADRFSSYFLAPRVAIHKFRCQNADQIHDIFGLSYAASNIALMSYKKWYAYICQTTRKPSGPERDLEQIFLTEISEKANISKRKSLLSSETENCITFFDKLNFVRGGDYMFRRAESQRLYGNDY